MDRKLFQRLWLLLLPLFSIYPLSIGLMIVLVEVVLLDNPSSVVLTQKCRSKYHGTDTDTRGLDEVSSLEASMSVGALCGKFFCYYRTSGHISLCLSKAVTSGNDDFQVH